MIDMEFWSAHYDNSLTHSLNGMCLALHLHEKKEHVLSDNSFNKAISETESYFTEMFKRGHLETIPMPEFAMIMPPENLASFQKFCAEQAQGLSEKEVTEIVLPSSVPRFKKQSSNSGLDTDKTPEQIIANTQVIASKLPKDL